MQEGMLGLKTKDRARNQLRKEVKVQPEEMAKEKNDPRMNRKDEIM